VCVCVYTYTYIYTYKHTCKSCTHACVCVCARSHTRVCIYTCTYARVCVRARISMHICTSTTYNTKTPYAPVPKPNPPPKPKKQKIGGSPRPGRYMHIPPPPPPHCTSDHGTPTRGGLPRSPPTPSTTPLHSPPPSTPTCAAWSGGYVGGAHEHQSTSCHFPRLFRLGAEVSSSSKVSSSSPQRYPPPQTSCHFPRLFRLCAEAHILESILLLKIFLLTTTFPLTPISRVSSASVLWHTFSKVSSSSKVSKGTT
jgi:hypothetical protein